MRKKLLCIILSGLLLALGGCGRQTESNGNSGNNENTSAPSESGDDVADDDTYIDEIKERGFLIVGCKTDVPGLGFYEEETNTWSGLEVELAYQTAANIFDVSIDQAKEQKLVKLVGVTVADREERLEEGDVDCLLATYTITEERKKRFAFSDSYYTDYIGLMVKTSGENPNSLGTSDIRSIADLDGKNIGVPKNATTRKTFLNYIETMNTLKVSPIFYEYESYAGLFQALKADTIDVMAVDVSILNGYVDSSTVILNDRFGGQHYGAAVLKEHAPLLDYINEALNSTPLE